MKGGTRPGAGRPVGSTKELTKPVILRLSERHAVIYKELGGQRWIRRLLDESKPDSTPATSG